MQENLSQSLLRGEKIELVQERADSLMKTSGGYLNTSRSVKREMQCRKYKMIAAAVLVVMVSKDSSHPLFRLLFLSFCSLFAGSPSVNVIVVRPI